MSMPIAMPIRIRMIRSCQVLLGERLQHGKDDKQTDIDQVDDTPAHEVADATRQQRADRHRQEGQRGDPPDLGGPEVKFRHELKQRRAHDQQIVAVEKAPRRAQQHRPPEQNTIGTHLLSLHPIRPPPRISPVCDPWPVRTSVGRQAKHDRQSRRKWPWRRARGSKAGSVAISTWSLLRSPCLALLIKAFASRFNLARTGCLAGIDITRRLSVPHDAHAASHAVSPC